jgi:hypothetical protein
MNLAGIENKNLSASARMILWLTFGIYIFVACYTMLYHEPWGDELHSWNLAKGSNTFLDLIQNRKYEGHPPVWYIILWLISRFTHNPLYMQWIHVVIAISSIFLLLFYSPFNTVVKVLIPFGYYFLFEYAILSRNYSPGVLAGFLICITLTKQFRFKVLLYYVLLMVMSYTHLLAVLLAGSLHLYFLMTVMEGKKRRTLMLHLFLGVLVFLPAIYFVKPPPSSDLALASWIDSWSTDRLAIAVQSPLRAFVPMPAWWKYHFWNQHFLLDLHAQYKALKLVSPLLSLGLLFLGTYILKSERKSLVLFITNVALTFIIGNIYPLITQRYVGFIFVGFIMACWLHLQYKPMVKSKHTVIAILLAIQMIAGIFIVIKDIKLPFSNDYKIKALLDKVPPGEQVVTDYWALIGANTYMDRAYYCVDLEQDGTFIQWGANMVNMRKKPYRYYTGIDHLFQQYGLKQLYLFSTSSPAILFQIDQKIFSAYKVEVVEKMEGSIEKWSNLYLYRISTK